MNIDHRSSLLAERETVKRMLAETPVTAVLTRMSDEARLRNIEAELAALPADECNSARARLTFNGLPVVGSHGIFADFGMKAVSSFTDAVATVAASLSAPLAAMGPIPNRDQNQLLITSTAVGSFGFELEEYRAPELAQEKGESAVAVALERTQSLLQATLGRDDDLADIASETDPRALDKVRGFLRVLADNDAICALQYGDTAMRFADPGQVKRSLARLAADNLRESQEMLEGEFVGVLPVARTFEFKLAGSDEIARGKISPKVGDVEKLNEHLRNRVRIDVMRTQVGNGRPRFLLTQMPQWVAAPDAATPAGD
jgi:hypothetical protein